MPVKKPADSDKGGKMGISGPNVRDPKTPPLPNHYGGSKSSKYGS